MLFAINVDVKLGLPCHCEQMCYAINSLYYMYKNLKKVYSTKKYTLLQGIKDSGKYVKCLSCMLIICRGNF